MHDRVRALTCGVRLALVADPWRASACMLLFVLQPLALVFSSYGLKLVLDDASRRDLTAVIYATTAITLVVALSLVGGLYAVRFSHTAIEKAAHQIDLDLVRLMTLPPGVGHMEQAEYLDQVEQLVNQQPQLAETFDVLALLTGAALRAVVTGILLASVNPLLLLVPLFALPTLRAGARAEGLRQLALGAHAADSRRAKHYFDLAVSATAGKELRIYGLQDVLLQRHARLLRATDSDLDRAAWRGFVTTGAGWAVFAVGYFGALLLILTQAVHHRASLGDVVLALTLLTSVNVQMAQTVRLADAVERSLAAARCLLRLQEWPGTQVRTAAIARSMTAPPDRLTDGILLRRLRFRYPGSEDSVIDDVDLHLPAGRVIGLVGENGAGKSSLVKLLTGLYEPTAGQILIDGHDLTQLSAPAWRERVSPVLQDFARIESTFQKTVGLGHLPELMDENAVRAALRRADATELVQELPAGLATPIGRSYNSGVDLSGGQWQRLALARAMMRRRPLLQVFDEPTAAIDARSEQELLDRHIADAHEIGALTGAVTVIVSHRLTSLRNADMIVVLAHGRVAESGTHVDLLAHCGLYAELYTLQAGAYR